MDRALHETAKIAQLNHPLIVATYQFQLVEQFPYSVMELVAGSSGKEWLQGNPTMEARTLLWKLYSRALRFIHGTGEIHGDPHLGNVLVFPDPGNIYGHDMDSDNSPFSIKVADTGTSVFWSKRADILRREANLMYETARKLFLDGSSDRLWFHPSGLSYEQTLNILDVLCEYFSQLSGFIDHDRAAQNAENLVVTLMKAPLFELDAVTSQIRQTGATTISRFARRLNQKIFNLRDLFDGNDTIDEQTKVRYQAIQRVFIDSLRSATVQHVRA